MKPIHNAVLLDEKWYALGLYSSTDPATPVIRLFDILTDPGMKTNLAAKHPDLCDRASKEFSAIESERTH